jgi:hypothetical protein
LRKTLAAASAAAIASTTLATFGVASASADGLGAPQEKTPGIAWFGRKVVVDAHHPDRAVVHARYKCEGMAAHLWASAKQGEGVNSYVPTPERPSPPADVARAWYETPEDALPTCDGTFHTTRYVIHRSTGTDTHPEAWGRLHKGRAWAQFVVFSFPEGSNPETDEPNREAFAGWVRVVKRHYHHDHD